VAGYQYSNVTISDSNILGNKAIYGGAIFGQLYATFKLIRCSIQGNSGEIALSLLVSCLSVHSHLIAYLLLVDSLLYGRGY
jgi:hypothetical protein